MSIGFFYNGDNEERLGLVALAQHPEIADEEEQWM